METERCIWCGTSHWECREFLRPCCHMCRHPEKSVSPQPKPIQTKESEMEYEVLQSRNVVPNEWRVEAIGANGECYVTLFSGPDAEVRARQYAQWMTSPPAQEK